MSIAEDLKSEMEYNSNSELNIKRLKYIIGEMKKMWDKFSDIPVNNDDEIEEDFELWEAGTNKYDIWHWFDKHLPNGLVKDIINA